MSIASRDCLWRGGFNRLGISTDSNSSGTNPNKKTVLLEKNLIRMEPMPTPFAEIDSKPLTWTLPVGDKRYGHSSIIKADSNAPHYVLRDNVFLVESHTELGPTKEDWEHVTECSNNILIWLGTGPYQAPLPPGGDACMRIVTGEEGMQFWRERVTDWHRRHPDVGADYKPRNPGVFKWPRTPETEMNR